MRFARLAVAVVLVAVFELACGSRLAVLGATADLLFILACVALPPCGGLRPGEGVPAACAIGLVGDFLMGGRLGLMALSFGLGARTTEGVRPLLGRYRPGGDGPPLARAGGVFLTVLAGGAVAHATVAVLGAVLGEAPRALDVRMVRAVEIAFMTAAAAPLAWPVATLALNGTADERR